MPPKPCECADGHEFSKSEAENLDFKCNIDGTKITCDVNATRSMAISVGKKKSRAKTKKAPAKAKKSTKRKK